MYPVPCRGKRLVQSGKCVGCGAGMFKAGEGVSSSTCEAWQPCGPGFHCIGCGGSSEGKCVACVAGTFKAPMGRWDTTCTDCPVCEPGFELSAAEKKGEVVGIFGGFSPTRASVDVLNSYDAQLSGISSQLQMGKIDFDFSFNAMGRRRPWVFHRGRAFGHAGE